MVCLLKQLFERLCIMEKVSIQSLMDRLTPEKANHLQMALLRPPLHRETSAVYPDGGFTRQPAGLVSIKGEDFAVAILL